MFWILVFGCLFLGTKPTSSSFLEPNCGSMSQEALHNRHRQAHISESPWMAFLHASGRFLCGGSLINTRFVLTAAHCIVYGETLTVRLGEYDTATDRDCSGGNCIPPYEEFGIDKAFRNRAYSKTNRFHDIGLLRLSWRVTYKEHIKPICLITNTNLLSQIENMQQFVATGWGSSSPGSPSRTLKSIQVNRLERGLCRERYLVDCSRDQICVGHETGEACSGDSGGPMGHMVRVEGKVAFVQVGIVSYGNPECLSPSVFTNVMSHIDWIKMVVERYSW